jgi:aminopeptidase
VFTLPHRDQADGYVTMTRPLSVNGVMIDNFTLTFQGGRITNITATNNVEVLEGLIASDEGAAHLGEVALVPASNPIAAMNRFFYDALFDENAASHIAMGRAYRFTLQGGGQMSKPDFAAAGGNDSIIHEDTMIGSAEMNVDGINADGTREPVMRSGEWAITV